LRAAIRVHAERRRALFRACDHPLSDRPYD